MACSKEEIEKKRLAALQKRQNVLTKPVNIENSYTKITQNKSAFLNNKLSSPINYHPYAKTKSPNVNTSTPVTKVVSGTVYLISENRFEVNPSEFCPPLINIFKTIRSKSYDPNSKLWNFSVDDYEELMSKITPLAPHIVLGQIPQYVIKILRENMVDFQSIDLSPIENTIRNKLLPFQEEGVRFGISRHGRCLIADDMGLGKTFQALAIVSYYRHNWPLLIVTTSSMRDTWQSKIHELLPSVPMMNVVTLTTGKDTELVADRQTEVVIVSFKITSMHSDLLKSKKFGAVIIDESHNLKSHKAQCTSALVSICRHAARVVLPSGTPALSRPAELYSQLALIEPSFFKSYTEYGKRYCAGKQTAFGWDMSGQSNLTELQIILNRRFLIRRTKEQVLELEEKTRESVLLDETLLDYSAQTQLTQMAEACRTASSEKHAALITYFSESARFKIPPVCKYIKQTLRETEEKFLVFAHHRNMIEAICDTLDEAGAHYICIVGSTPPHTRAELVNKFQESGSCRCGVLSVTAAGAGLTLTAAGLVLFAELHWNPGVLTQAEARAHRLGRRGSVRVRYLLARRTADDVMWPLLQGKLDVLNSVGLSEDTFQNTTMKHQESKNNITQYLSPVALPKNKNEYIPGTNIRKSTQQKLCFNEAQPKYKSNETIEQKYNSNETTEQKYNSNESAQQKYNSNETTQLKWDSNIATHNFCNIQAGPSTQKSFMEDDEDDELLANLDL
ncbi:SWI/SNF-related matrix-associated actin-dependent regulator of chromatin subfamily A-like protein 1 [Aricia agestis]|uniref:SWI/SNF-related matrix-associated actin-dependent regulator of chromatin subfamily A-like protein 1 n=1 Tax=Aricia agestis TaxID=91739 RepID=UPI001C209F9A|nr:SWI/SNF-related matrix-associated actin-dependent regulator of chromatin subfamily A-like protein 1 [Aricia agestis]